MNQPAMFEAQSLHNDTVLFNAYLPVPGFGVLPVNAFLLRAQQPVLIDTGVACLGGDFRKQLHRFIDPQDLRWIWITHADFDHIGNLPELMDEAPNARIVTTYIGMAKMSLQGLPLDRMFLLNPGQSLDAGDRKLLAVAPPTFDAPETCGLFDAASGTLFSADSFGALLPAPAETAEQIDPRALRDGCVTWATLDAPWLHNVDAGRFDNVLRKIRQLNPGTVLSSHLPPAMGLVDDLIANLKQALQAPRFVGPDQAQLEQLMAA